MQRLYVEGNEPPMYLRFGKQCIQYALKLRNNPENPTYDVVFNPLYPDRYSNKLNAIQSFGQHIEADLAVVCPQLD